ncbi:MAG: GntR family transcriptional repressor for pyruvate dehydrogenase complex [Gammaproteobacteria bacterium]|jgi:GntR family transcriptional repressor for pyruvate dehydrogenase complex
MKTTQGENSGITTSDIALNNQPFPMRVGSTTGTVVAKIRARILDGQYSLDERLPAERHLAEEFQVSRGTIRSVLKILEQQNLVNRQLGSGTYVTHREIPSQQEISSITSPLEMVEVRIAIEPQMIRLAIANASHRDLLDLHQNLKQCEDCGGDAEKFARADTEFHMALARCSKNKLLYWVYERISEVRQFSQWRSAKAKLLTPERIGYYNNQHRLLFEAISSRDTTEAVKLIKSHLYGVHTDLIET